MSCTLVFHPWKDCCSYSTPEQTSSTTTACSPAPHDYPNLHEVHESLGVQKPTTPAPLKEDILCKGLVALSQYIIRDSNLQEKDMLD